tara:strand:- start:134 stop:355 length:222 start_codon:yes stop_codon:yes gene_type:complete
MTIYEIKRLTQETAPYFFSRDAMRFFGQTLKSFSVKKQDDGRYRVSASSGNNWDSEHETVRFFNPENNELESK